MSQCLTSTRELRCAARCPEGSRLREDLRREGLQRPAGTAGAQGRSRLYPGRRCPRVWKLDRLARSLKQLIETIEGLEGKQTGFRSLTEAIDTTTSGGRLVFHIFAALAEFERSLIRERTRSGLESARARGRLGGRPPSLSPADLQAFKALLSDPAITVEEAARRLGVAPSTFYRHLPGGRSAV